MGVIDVKKVKYSYGKFIVKGTGTGESGGISPEDMENIKQYVDQEVASQIAGHDLSVNDTHHIEPEGDEYPDVTVFNEEETQ